MIDFDGADEWDWTDTVEVTITYTQVIPREMLEALELDFTTSDEANALYEKASESLDLLVGELVHMTTPDVQEVIK